MDGGTRDMYRGTNIVTVPPISGQLETMLLARFFLKTGWFTTLLEYCSEVELPQGSEPSLLLFFIILIAKIYFIM